MADNETTSGGIVMTDALRAELAAMGIAVKINKDGSVSWEVKR